MRLKPTPRILAVALVLSVGAAAVTGCGSSGGGSAPGGLDCAWLAGNNCWKATTQLAAASSQTKAGGTARYRRPGNG